MNKTTWADWRGEVEQAFEALSNQVDHVFVCGLSMGGALALRFAADHPSSAGRPRAGQCGRRHRPQGRQAAAGPQARHSLDARHRQRHQEARCRGARLQARPRCAPPPRCSRATRQLCDDLGRVTCPVLIYRSTVDHVVDPSSGADHPGARSGPATYARSCWRTATTWRRSTTTPSASSRVPLRSSSASPGLSPEADPHRDHTAGPRGRARRRRAPRRASRRERSRRPGRGSRAPARRPVRRSLREDELWQAIVENYGERPQIEELIVDVPPSPRDLTAPRSRRRTTPATPSERLLRPTRRSTSFPLRRPRCPSRLRPACSRGSGSSVYRRSCWSPW